MVSKVAAALVVVAIALPGAALAAKPAKLKVGQPCSTKKEATYKAHHFTCVKGHLRVLKTKKK